MDTVTSFLLMCEQIELQALNKFVYETGLSRVGTQINLSLLPPLYFKTDCGAIEVDPDRYFNNKKLSEVWNADFYTI